LSHNTSFVYCKVNGGREGRPIGAYELAKAVEELGAGEILLNCIDCDGQSHSLSLYLIKCCFYSLTFVNLLLSIFQVKEKDLMWI
jgi:imidazole glycerol phosphate synthase subunit HisF